MDRTTEFFSTVAVLKSLGHAGQGMAAPAGASPLQRGSLEHARASKRAHRQIAKLGELSLQQGQFNNPGPRINELCFALKRELTALDTSLRALTEAVGRLDSSGAPLDSPSGARAHWQAVLDILQAHLLVLTRGFQDALRARAATLQPAAASPSAPTSAAAPSAAAAAAAAPSAVMHHSTWVPEYLPEASPLFAPPQPSSSAGAPAALRKRGAAAPPLSYGQPRHHHAAATAAATPSYGYSAQTLHAMHDSRARASDAAAVETVIVELGGMFTRMASLVGEQGDVLARIDADVVEAEGNVKAGHEELSKLYESMQKNRGFILQLFGVLIFVICLVKLVY